MENCGWKKGSAQGTLGVKRDCDNVIFIGKDGVIISDDTKIDDVQKVIFRDDCNEVSERLLSNFENLTDVKFHSNIKKIGRAAFSKCLNLEEIDLPEGLEEIGDRAFEFCCSLGEAPLIIPSTVKKIGKDVFQKSGVYHLVCSEDFAEMYAKQCSEERIMDLYIKKGEYICNYKITPATGKVRRHFYRVLDRSTTHANSVRSKMKYLYPEESGLEYIASQRLNQQGEWEDLTLYSTFRDGVVEDEKLKKEISKRFKSFKFDKERVL